MNATSIDILGKKKNFVLKSKELTPGLVTAVRGSVVDIRFEDHLPPIYNLLHTGKDGQIAMEVQSQLDARLEGQYLFCARVSSSRPASDFTTCIIPRYEDINVPLENNLIRWQS
jgi:F0F1-type ATP synthase beta subunit